MQLFFKEYFQTNLSYSDLVVALLSGISVYTMLGFVKTKCKETALDISKCNDIYETGSFGLAFVIYPVGISNSTASHLWGLLFFGCLLFLGIDSAYAMVISLTTVLEDAWFCRRLNLKKPVLNGVVCVTVGVCYFLDFLKLSLLDGKLSLRGERKGDQLPALWHLRASHYYYSTIDAVPTYYRRIINAL
eukprot:sb/3471224/